jgi:hypothetical protein
MRFVVLRNGPILKRKISGIRFFEAGDINLQPISTRFQPFIRLFRQSTANFKSVRHFP